MYELLAGQRPYPVSHDEDKSVVEARIMSREAVDLSPIERVAPPSLVAVIEKCLHKDPSERYHTMQALEMDLRRNIN
jgi:hypothetical protein